MVSAMPELPLHSDTGGLLRAVLAISGELDLDIVLEQLVSAAADLTGARYGALGVVGPDDTLARFVTSGLTPEQESAIGPRPTGRGVLGTLLTTPLPVRIDDVGAHPDSVGFPANHPVMRSFLGVPVRIRGTVFGNLYLTDKAGGGSFTSHDEQLTVALAQAAALVIENARAYGQSERRRRWLEAAAELDEALLPPVTPEDALRQVAARARVAARASAAIVVQFPPGGHPIVSAADTVSGEDVLPLVRRIIDEVRIAEDQSVVLDVRLDPGRRAHVVPLVAHLADPGALVVVTGIDSADPSWDEREFLATFVDRASAALDRTQAFTDRQELALVKERARIARDLHDLVIQRLFAAGLKLQTLRTGAEPAQESSLVDDVIEDLDRTIEDIRTTIFGLQQHALNSLRGDVLRLIEEYETVLGHRPSLRTRGPVDLLVTGPVADNLRAVLREALSNVARHAGAEHTAVEVNVGREAVELVVTDDGTGLPADRNESGLRNARERAELLGGSLTTGTGARGGTILRWQCPLAHD